MRTVKRNIVERSTSAEHTESRTPTRPVELDRKQLRTPSKHRRQVSGTSSSLAGLSATAWRDTRPAAAAAAWHRKTSHPLAPSRYRRRTSAERRPARTTTESLECRPCCRRRTTMTTTSNVRAPRRRHSATNTRTCRTSVVSPSATSHCRHRSLFRRCPVGRRPATI